MAETQTVGRLSGAFRYPVKSMGGEALDALTLGQEGAPGDRAWAVRDERAGGGVRGAKRFPALMRCSARYLEPPADTGSSPAEVTLPDGRVMMTGDPGLPGALSELVGETVTFWPLMPADMLDHYRRGAPAHEDFEQELRSIFGREPGEALPDLGKFPEQILEFESPPGTYFDAFPLLLLTQQSLDTMAAKRPESQFDQRRFRPNLLIDSDVAEGAPFPELAWVGRRLRIGAVELKVIVDCPRCVMTTHGFADLPQDRQIMRALVQEAEGSLGVYAKVVTPGTARVGDPVSMVAAA
ncbi:MAG: MOSC domain-containing protein [Pseudomonadota bacterium]